MKRVLVLAYYFPPLGGVGPQRTVKFLKHLRALGYEPLVVAGPEQSRVAWAPPDESLAAEVPESIRVVRIRNFPPATPARWARFNRLLGRWSSFEQWWHAEAVNAARIVLEVDLVYASMSPFGTAAAAATLADEARVPWVADLEDPWALDEWKLYPTALHRALDRRRMRNDLASAAAVIMNTAEATRVLTSRFPELASRAVTIPQGWDRADFSGLPGPPAGDPFRVVYAGYSHVEPGLEHRARRRRRELLGGATRGLDVLARSHVFLLEALERLSAQHPELARRVELHVAGASGSSAEVRSDLVRVHYHGYLPHDRALGLIRSAGVLFLAMHGLPHGLRATTVPGKTYEYLAAERPIIAALPEGDARDLLASLPNVWLCAPTDVDCFAAAIQAAMSSDSGGTASANQLEPFEWSALAMRLAEVFDGVLGAGVAQREPTIAPVDRSPR